MALTEELADLMEVIRAIASQTNIKMDEIETARITKFNERGGFEKRIKLISTF